MKANRKADRRCNMCIRKILGKCDSKSPKKAIECSNFLTKETEQEWRKKVLEVEE